MLIKKIVCITLFAFVFIVPAKAISQSDISAESAVVMDGDSLAVLFEKNSDTRRSMASTTKIMTSIIAMESGKLNSPVVASRDIVTDGTSVGISKGDTFTLNTLVHAMMLESGNDAAVLTAEFLAGNESNFSVMMNSKAESLGMINTNFVTSSGLDDEEHFSTAYDMSILASYAIKNPIFRSVCQKLTYNAEYISPMITVTYTNHNKLLKMYDGILGVKTGFTKKSGRCLVSACEKDGRTLVVTTLNAPDDWNDHIKLYEYFFKNTDKKNIESTVPDTILIYGGVKNCLKIHTSQISIYDVEGEVECDVILSPFIYAPISKGDAIGEVVISSNGEIISRKSILASESVASVEGKRFISKNIILKLKYIIRNLLKG